MTNVHKFTAVIEDSRKGGAYVIVPIDVEEVFGKKRVNRRLKCLSSKRKDDRRKITQPRVNMTGQVTPSLSV